MTDSPAAFRAQHGIATISYGELPPGLDCLKYVENGRPPISLRISGEYRIPDAYRVPGVHPAMPGIAVVGSRAATTYGEHVAADLGAGLAERGFAVLNTGGYGVEASALRGAMGAGGQTVVVAPGGLAQPYPPGNAALLERVTAVLSEQPDDRVPTRTTFEDAARLVAALSVGVVVVEAAVRSNVVHVVEWAERLGRPVLAIPGPVTSIMSMLPHQLIASGRAQLVTGVDDVMLQLFGDPGFTLEED